MSDDLVKRARHNAQADMPHYASVELIEAMADRIEELERLTEGQAEQLEIQGNNLAKLSSFGHKQADRIEELEAENKRLNEQMAAIEEYGTESLNALPDCLMKLAPALVEVDELKAKLAKAMGALEEGVRCTSEHGGAAKFLRIARTTLAELKGEKDE
jgi:chromosome segregation ATPase